MLLEKQGTPCETQLSSPAKFKATYLLLQMQVDVLIIGQGICGTMLSWFLYKSGKSFLVIDDNRETAPSKVAAGIINPVTGRRFVYSWMIDTVMPFAASTYHQISEFLEDRIIIQRDIIDFFPSAQMRDAFTTRITENDTYLHSYPSQNDFNPYFNYEFGCGQISPSYMVDLTTLINQWRNFLDQKQLLAQQEFNVESLRVEPDAITYENITAEKIIFCNGSAAMEYDWFKALPFSPSKGEVLLIESEGLTAKHIFKKGFTIAPLFQENLFWVGSSYQWEYEHDQPTEAFYQQTKNHLDNWLKVPYKIVDHKAALRPSTLERRPFVGFHPQYPSIGILNGMGTKGTSLAPFFANQLVQNLLYGFPITPESNLQRFNRILSK